MHLTGVAIEKKQKNIMRQQYIDTILYKNYENAQSNSLHCNKGLKKKGLFWPKNSCLSYSLSSPHPFWQLSKGQAAFYK